jgi:chlorophyll(ide) b reductase
VDLWINNAGSNGYAFGPLMDQAEEDLVAIVETNVLGTLLGCREAIRVMRTQRGGGHVFNMDGAGADGGATPRFAAYGATKRSLEQLGKSLRSELRAAGVGNVGVHNLSPGMVTTQLLMAGADTRVARFFINVLAEEPATVAAALVPRMRAAPAEARTPLGAIAGGSYIRFLTKPRAYAQIIKRLVRGERKDRYVSED